jgi:branched-chain amino acid transport system permease protein
VKNIPWRWIALTLFLILPLADRHIGHFSANLIPIFVFAIFGLGLNLVTGCTGMLNLGAAAFMAIGAYAFAILTCDIYPFQIGFWPGLGGALLAGAAAGWVLGLPTMRLRGDYLAIVTLGFGEITQDLLRNLAQITKGTQSINPLPPPTLPGYAFTAQAWQPWYYLYLALLVLVVIVLRNLENSRIGRALVAIREDELAAASMGINVGRTKLAVFAGASALCALAGALYACRLGSSGEPSTYDFQMSIAALCIVILGGMGNINGVLLGALIVMGFNGIVLDKLNDIAIRNGWTGTGTVFASPNNWKYFIFGLTLVLMMRFRPEGLLPSRRLREEIRDKAAAEAT